MVEDTKTPLLSNHTSSLTVGGSIAHLQPIPSLSRPKKKCWKLVEIIEGRGRHTAVSPAARCYASLRSDSSHTPRFHPYFGIYRDARTISCVIWWKVTPVAMCAHVFGAIKGWVDLTFAWERCLDAGWALQGRRGAIWRLLFGDLGAWILGVNGRFGDGFWW